MQKSENALSDCMPDSAFTTVLVTHPVYPVDFRIYLLEINLLERYISSDFAFDFYGMGYPQTFYPNI